MYVKHLFSQLHLNVEMSLHKMLDPFDQTSNI